MLTTSCTLYSIPRDIYEMVQKEQSEIKAKKRTGMFSFECTIYKMIKDYDRCRDESKNFNEDPAEFKKEKYDTSSYNLKCIPPEVYKIILKEQERIRNKLNTRFFGLEWTIYKMLRDYNKCRKESPDFKPEPV